MKYPKMIIFDSGHTLLNDYNFDNLKGIRAIYKFVKNKNEVSAELISRTYEKLYNEFSAARKLNFEMHNLQFQKLLYDYLGVEFTIESTEIEKIFWDNLADCSVMPGVDNMLDFINDHGIRSGVISNMDFSGKAFEDRINKMLPQNKFEFLIASSEYGVRKPSRYLFEIALCKAKLKPGEVWFCGDNVPADVIGSHEAGMYPVWYENNTVGDSMETRSHIIPEFEHLHIQEWKELTEILSAIE